MNEQMIAVMKQWAVFSTSLYIAWVHDCTRFYIDVLEDWRQ
jgi:hypothetical protein